MLTDLDITFGYTGGVRAAVLPSNANWKELEWEIDDPAVAGITVHPGTDSVTIKGLTEGTTTVMAQARDNSICNTLTVTVSRPDYSDGVFIVNEDWWGHSPGSANFLYDDGRIDHNVFQHANHTPLYQLGSPAQYGAIYGGKFYIISKAGLRLSITDARTMELHKGYPNLGGEGRFFFGVDEHTGYVGTANGIRVVNLDELLDESTPQIISIPPGTSISSIQTSGSPYTGQATTMKRVGERIFALQQGVLHVINAAIHQLETTLSDHIYITMTQAKDGNLWLGTSGTVPDGSQYNPQEDDFNNAGTLTGYFVRLDPYTLERTVVPLPNGINGTGSTFGAWQADAFQGSAQENVLYWKSGQLRILRYDIAVNKVDTVLDLSGMPLLPGVGAPWTLYGTAFAVNQETGELIVTTGTFMITCCVNQRNNWKILRVNPNGSQPRADDNGVIGNILSEHPLKQHYWFPAMPVFPDKHLPEFTAVPFPASITLGATHAVDSLGLLDKVADADNMRAAIVTTVLDGYNTSLLNAFIWRDTLVVAARKTIPAGQPAEQTQLTLKFNSNGHVLTKSFTVTVSAGTTAPENPDPGNPGTVVNPFELTQQALSLYPNQTAQLALTAPQHFSPTWRSTAVTVATVSATGLVTSHATGTALVIARDAATGKADTCRVTVSALPSAPEQPFTLNTSDLRLVQGERATLQVTVTPGPAGQTPQWSTSNRNVADGTAGGTVIGVAPGTAAVTATLGSVSAVCAVTVAAPVTQPTVSDVKQDAAQLAFPKAAGASYYLVHVYTVTPDGFSPALTLKVTPDGRVSLRSTAGSNLIVPLAYLSPGTSCVVRVETVRETGGKAEVIHTEVTAFTTAMPTGIDPSGAGEAKAYYATGALCLEHLEGSECTVKNGEWRIENENFCFSPFSICKQND